MKVCRKSAAKSVRRDDATGESEPSGGSALGNRLAALAFNGHKKRKREQESEKSRCVAELKKAFAENMSAFEREAELFGKTRFGIPFDCRQNAHWVPKDQREVKEALPEERSARSATCCAATARPCLPIS